MKNKLLKFVVLFLLLIPFRLPISVLFIKVTTKIASIAGNMSFPVLSGNVMVTKFFYDLALCSYLIISVRRLAIETFPLSEKYPGMYSTDRDSAVAHILFVSCLIIMICYFVYDLSSTYQILKIYLNN